MRALNFPKYLFPLNQWCFYWYKIKWQTHKGSRMHLHQYIWIWSNICAYAKPPDTDSYILYMLGALDKWKRKRNTYEQHTMEYKARAHTTRTKTDITTQQDTTDDMHPCGRMHHGLASGSGKWNSGMAGTITGFGGSSGIGGRSTSGNGGSSGLGGRCTCGNGGSSCSGGTDRCGGNSSSCSSLGASSSSLRAALLVTAHESSSTRSRSAREDTAVLDDAILDRIVSRMMVAICELFELWLMRWNLDVWNTVTLGCSRPRATRYL